MAKVKNEVRLLDWYGFEQKLPEVSADHKGNEEKLFFFAVETVIRIEQ